MWNLIKRSLKMGNLAEALPNDKEKSPRGRSFHLRHLDCGSCNGCDWEMTALLNPLYDLQRYGFDFVASPRHADILMCTGPGSTHLIQAAEDTYEAMASPKWVVAIGDCAIDGSVFKDCYAASSGVASILPISLEIPGCPPAPEEILKGLLRLAHSFDRD